MPKTVLIAGASGLLGSAALEHFLSQPDWNVVAISRRVPEIESQRSYRHLSLDLDDAASCRQALQGLSDVTHLVYAALFEKAEGLFEGWFAKDQIEKNGRMLRNVVDPLIQATKGNFRAIITHGTKAYGVHLPPPHVTKVPARESDPRVQHPNFYWVQEDYIKEMASQHVGLSYTFLRPPLIVNGVHGGAMSFLAAFGAYAALCKELNQPLGFPGSAANDVYQMVDARLLARMMGWAALAPEAKNQIFNCTNGDVFTWRDLWTALAATMGIAVGKDAPCQMSAFLPAHENTWSQIVSKYQLRPLKLRELLSTSDQFADILWGPGEKASRPAGFVSDIKRHKAGFKEVVDSKDVVVFHLEKLIKKGVLPSFR